VPFRIRNKLAYSPLVSGSHLAPLADSTRTKDKLEPEPLLLTLALLLFLPLLPRSCPNRLLLLHAKAVAVRCC
jgi:hypothetical protein